MTSRGGDHADGRWRMWGLPDQVFFVVFLITIHILQVSQGCFHYEPTDREGLWGTTEWDRQTTACPPFASFTDELQKVFETWVG